MASLPLAPHPPSVPNPSPPRPRSTSPLAAFVPSPGPVPSVVSLNDVNASFGHLSVGGATPPERRSSDALDWDHELWAAAEARWAAEAAAGRKPRDVSPLDVAATERWAR